MRGNYYFKRKQLYFHKTNRMNCLFCSAIFCPVLPPLANGSYSTDQVIYGTTVTARCKTGFMFPDHNLTRTFKCIDGVGLDAEWDDQRADKCQGEAQVEGSHRGLKDTSNRDFNGRTSIDPNFRHLG